MLLAPGVAGARATSADGGGPMMACREAVPRARCRRRGRTGATLPRAATPIPTRSSRLAARVWHCCRSGGRSGRALPRPRPCHGGRWTAGRRSGVGGTSRPSLRAPSTSAQTFRRGLLTGGPDASGAAVTCPVTSSRAFRYFAAFREAMPARRPGAPPGSEDAVDLRGLGVAVTARDGRPGHLASQFASSRSSDPRSAVASRPSRSSARIALLSGATG